MEPRAKVEPGSGKHSVYTHFPKDPNCDICLKTKIPRASCRRRTSTVVFRAEHFGDLITADHKILSKESESRNNHRHAVVVQDLATQWIQSYTCKQKLSRDPEDSKECYCYLLNIQDLLSVGPALYERRFGIPFNRPVIPFGAMVEYHLFFSAKDQSRLHQFGAKVLQGIFLGYLFYVGRIWKGDIMVADIVKKWRRWTHMNSTPEGSMQRKSWRRKEMENSSSLS